MTPKGRDQVFAITRGAAVAVLDLASASAAQAAPPSKTIGLVIGDFAFGLYQSPNGKVECPDGVQHKQAENYAALYPTPEARKAREAAFGYYTNRGPNGENAFYFPKANDDPLPFRDAHGPTAIGLNLDGDATGQGAGNSVPHENFTSPDGEAGIDNQLYRVLGCMSGWRKGGVIEGTITSYLRSDTRARLLLEITGVDDEQNDDDVTVTTYRGRDPIGIDSKDRLIPWLSQRIDNRAGARYINHLKGKIVDGVLITEPTDVRLPSYDRPSVFADRNLKQMRLRLKLTPDGAEGLMGGYYDVEDWYQTYARSWGGYVLADISGWSGPATYQAVRRFADYRPAGSQTATAISAGYTVGFTRVFILHDPAEGRQAAAPRAAGAQMAQAGQGTSQ